MKVNDMRTKEEYQTAFNKLNHIIDKLADWSGNDLSEVDDTFDLYENQGIIQELIDNLKENENETI